MLRLKNILWIIFGAGLFSFGINYLAIPNHLFEGGVTGVTLITYYLFKIRAIISEPPVVPPALKMIPSPAPRMIPAIKDTMTKSPSKSTTKGIFSKMASQADTENVPIRL